MRHLHAKQPPARVRGRRLAVPSCRGSSETVARLPRTGTGLAGLRLLLLLQIFREPPALPSLIYAKRPSLQAAHDADCTDPLEMQFKHFDGLSCPEPYAYPTPQAPCPDNLLPLAFRSVESVWSVSLAVHPSRAAGRVGTPSFAMIPAAADRARPRGVRLEVRTRHCLAG